MPLWKLWKQFLESINLYLVWVMTHELTHIINGTYYMINIILFVLYDLYNMNF